jgi:pyridoxamine 5'-phosphate oxidase
MTVSTVGKDGRVSSRILLLKAFDESGFTFFTNYHSHKGQQLAENPHTAICFFWPHVERQVRIEGTVEKVDTALSDTYFQSRPRSSQLGAWVSEQSQVVADRATLERDLQQHETAFADGPVPRPEHWGGYRVAPAIIEFWQGRPSRLHDRIVYPRTDDGTWQRVRLSP